MGPEASAGTITLNPEVRTAIDEAVVAINGIVSVEDANRLQSTELAVYKSFSELESIEAITEARNLLISFIEDREYPLTQSLVSAVGNSLVHTDSEVAGVIGFQELIDGGDLRAGDSPSDEDITVVDHYVEVASRYGVDVLPITILSKSLEIEEHLHGIDLMRALTLRIEEGAIDADKSLELGIISAERHKEILEELEDEEIERREKEEQEQRELDDDVDMDDYEDDSMEEQDELDDEDVAAADDIDNVIVF